MTIPIRYLVPDFVVYELHRAEELTTEDTPTMKYYLCIVLHVPPITQTGVPAEMPRWIWGPTVVPANDEHHAKSIALAWAERDGKLEKRSLTEFVVRWMVFA